MLAVEGGGNAFDNGDLVSGFEALREGFTGLARALAIVGADEWNRQPRLFDRFGVQLVIDVHDQDAGIFGALEDGDHRL